MVPLLRTSVGLWLALALSSLIGVAADISYPAHMEVDLLFPRNETYNNLTSFPVVVAIQNAEAAYMFDWDIAWRMFNASPGARETDYVSGYTSYGGLALNKFQYYFGDVAVVPILGYNFTRMDPGQYRLEWSYTVSSCRREPPNTIVYEIGNAVAVGTSYFSIVDDRTGLDFDIPTGECPLFGDIWSVRESTYTYCPFTASSDGVGRDPCAATLESREQVECLREYIWEGRNETETCSWAFKRADPEWPDYEDSDDDDDEEVEDVDQGEDSSEPADSSISPSDDHKDLAVSIRPRMLGVVTAGMVTLAMI